jgi:tetratricopeptide (TPR) repeat protein
VEWFVSDVSFGIQVFPRALPVREVEQVPVLSGLPDRGANLLPWRDPHSVPPEELTRYVNELERLCELHPNSCDLRTCLGIAQAMRFEVYKSMDALERAVEIDPQNFLAQIKYAELFYRLRALERAEHETLRALDLCQAPWELALGRKQLQEIRRLRREGTQKPTWTKSLGLPALLLAAFFLLVSLFMRTT